MRKSIHQTVRCVLVAYLGLVTLTVIVLSQPPGAAEIHFIDPWGGLLPVLAETGWGGGAHSSPDRPYYLAVGLLPEEQLSEALIERVLNATPPPHLAIHDLYGELTLSLSGSAYEGAASYSVKRTGDRIGPLLPAKGAISDDRFTLHPLIGYVAYRFDEGDDFSTLDDFVAEDYISLRDWAMKEARLELLAEEYGIYYAFRGALATAYNLQVILYDSTGKSLGTALNLHLSHDPATVPDPDPDPDPDPNPGPDPDPEPDPDPGPDYEPEPEPTPDPVAPPPTPNDEAQLLAQQEQRERLDTLTHELTAVSRALASGNAEVLAALPTDLAVDTAGPRRLPVVEFDVGQLTHLPWDMVDALAQKPLLLRLTGLDEPLLVCGAEVEPSEPNRLFYPLDAFVARYGRAAQ